MPDAEIRVDDKISLFQIAEGFQEITFADAAVRGGGRSF